jgi:subtilisin family serine protease
MKFLAVSKPTGRVAATRPGPAERRLGAALLVVLVLTIWGQPFSASTGLLAATGPTRARLWLEEIGISQLRDNTGVKGQGITVAVVDTGIDPTLPSLVGADRAKLVDWVDLTAEGRVLLRAASEIQGDMVRIDGQWVRLGQKRSRSGRYMYGWLTEAQLRPGGGIDRDLDGNGRRDDSFLVIAVDTAVAGNYDTVYIDSNRDLSLADEQGISPFRNFREYVVLQSEGGIRGGTGVVIAGLDPAGAELTVGFDGHGHGTQIAAIVGAESTQFGAGMTGIAPGCRLLAIKALGSDGHGTWRDIASAVEYAGAQGAQVVLISAATSGPYPSQESQSIAETARQYGLLVVLAAGNEGPGLNSFGTVPSGPNVVVAGAMKSPEMWKAAGFTGTLDHTTVPAYSSVGGRLGTPTLVAPASAVSLVASWAGTYFASIEGTSVSAAYIAGGVALLMEAAQKARLALDPEQVVGALKHTSEALPGISVLEQGYGVPCLGRAWAYLRRGLGCLESALSTDYGTYGAIAVVEESVAEVQWSLFNRSDRPVQVELVSRSDWARPVVSSLVLPPGATRLVPVQLSPPSETGLHQARLDAVDERGDTLSTVFAVLLLPYGGLSGGDRMHVGGSVQHGRTVRHHFVVDWGTTTLYVHATRTAGKNVTVPAGSLYVYDPFGRKVGTIELDGQDQPGLLVEYPTRGIWECVLYVEPTAAACDDVYGLDLAFDGYYVNPALTFSAEYGEWQTRFHYHGPSQQSALRVVRSLTPAAAGRQLLILQQAYARFQPTTPVPSGASSLTVSVGRPSVPGTELALYLYYYDPALRRYREVGASVMPGTAEQQVRVTRPEPGQYVAYIEVRRLPGSGRVSVEYQEHIISDFGAAVQPATVELAGGTERALAITGVSLGASELRLEVRDPAGDGHDLYLPIWTARPGITVQVVPGAGRVSGGAMVSLHVLGEDQARIRAPITVDGVKYEPRSGRITVRVPESGESVRLDIAINEVAQQLYVAGEIEVSLGHGRASSLARPQELSDERYRKFMTFLEGR